MELGNLHCSVALHLVCSLKLAAVEMPSSWQTTSRGGAGGDARAGDPQEPHSWVSCTGFYYSAFFSGEYISFSTVRQSPTMAASHRLSPDWDREFGGLQDGGRQSARAAGDLRGLRPRHRPPCVLWRHHHHHRLPPPGPRWPGPSPWPCCRRRCCSNAISTCRRHGWSRCCGAEQTMSGIGGAR